MPSYPNLEPHKFLPGQSGNPSGRPKKTPVTTIVREQLERPVPKEMLAKLPEVFLDLYPNPTFADMVGFKLIASACKGDILALKEMLERVEGKVAQKTELSGNFSLADKLSKARSRK